MRDFLAKGYFLAIWKEGLGEAADQAGEDVCSGRREVVMKMVFVALMEHLADW